MKMLVMMMFCVATAAIGDTSFRAGRSWRLLSSADACEAGNPRNRDAAGGLRGQRSCTSKVRRAGVLLRLPLLKRVCDNSPVRRHRRHRVRKLTARSACCAPKPYQMTKTCAYVVCPNALLANRGPVSSASPRQGVALAHVVAALADDADLHAVSASSSAMSRFACPPSSAMFACPPS